MASPPAWGEFDRFDLRPASDRVQEVFHRTGFRDIVPDNSLPVNSRFKAEALQLLTASGWANGERIVLLNPGGLWETRHWPLDHYVDLAQLWMDNEPVRFVFVGTERIRTRAAIVAGRIGGRAIDLTGQTSLGQALAVLQCCTCVISEDSGLLHLAWAAGVPVVALFGSSRHVWSAPTGPKARVFHSGDLPCGQCMHASCRYGDVHCLSRVTPGMVYTSAREMTATAVLEGDHR
jgi:heptosyltransferase-2